MEQDKENNELLVKINNCSSLQEVQNLKSYCNTPTTRKAIDAKYFALCRKKKDYKRYCSLFGPKGTYYKDAQKAGKTVTDSLKENKGCIVFMVLCLVVFGGVGIGVGMIWGSQGLVKMFGILALIFFAAAFQKGDTECGLRFISFCLACIFAIIAYIIAQSAGL